MDPLLLLLRILHIASGIFWVGAAFAFFLFVGPSAKAIGPDGQGAFLHQVGRVRRFPKAILGAGIITVLAGATLYWRDSGGLSADWIATGTGIGFSIGAVAGIASLALGLTTIEPTINRLLDMGVTLRTEGRPPTAEEGATLVTLDQRLTRVGQIDLVLLSIAVLMMATARYLG